MKKRKYRFRVTCMRAAYAWSMMDKASRCMDARGGRSKNRFVNGDYRPNSGIDMRLRKLERKHRPLKDIMANRGKPWSPGGARYRGDWWMAAQ